ncbi:hydrogenase expression/formation protein HypD [Clostridiales bacterium oral taxon 876 str. F0540]|nr:hydrogenase expression/formation protein HypD [Clostridiales bacterium oral taxon 876 str. F0540]
MDMQLINKQLKYINSFEGNINLMEVCGTHTMAISKFGIRTLINSNINLISGPGCPVCVTPDIYLDYIYDLSLKDDIVVATYGDMIRVPGSDPARTLENAKAKGATVKMVYSSMDALKLTEKYKDKKVVFLGIGFETTAPATAIAVREAQDLGISNFYVLSMHKLVEPVMRLLLEDKELEIHGFLCPGHVGVVIGEEGFKFLEQYNCPGAIAGFEMEEVVSGIFKLVKNIKEESCNLENPYKKLVRPKGNKAAQALIQNTFKVEDDYWRGMGLISSSGLKLSDEFEKFNIENIYKIPQNKVVKNNGCRCGDVLKGKIKPNECSLFKNVCNPENPIGPCMVSSEGSCSAYFKYSPVSMT